MTRARRYEPPPSLPPPGAADEDLGELMDLLGRSRNTKRVEAAIKGRRRSSTRAGRRLLRETVAAAAGAVKEWLDRSARQAANGSAAAALLKGLNPGSVALVASRVVVDACAGPAPLTAVAYRVGQALEDEARCVHVRRAARDLEKREAARGEGGGRHNSLWDDLSRRLRRERDAGARRAILRNTAHNLGAAFVAWPRREKVRLGVVLVELLRQRAGLVDIVRAPVPGKRPRAEVVPTDGTLAWLEHADRADANAAPFWLPTLTVPADWEDAWSGGYRTNLVLRRPLVKTRDRAVVDAVQAALPGVHLRAVNALQRAPWRVNRAVHDVARRLWDAGSDLPGFRPRMEAPCPDVPNDMPEGHDRELAVRARADWCSINRQHKSMRVMHARTLWLADRYRESPAFYFPLQADFRGRVYPQPYFLQPQGDDLARALLEFAEGKPVADRQALDALLVHGASLFGQSKASVRDRIGWARQNHARLVAMAADPYANADWTAADKPWQALAFCLEYARTASGDRLGPSHLPVQMDHSTSGLQVYALLTRDPELAAATNVAPADAPVDVYQVVADEVTARLLSDPNPEAAKWVAFLGGRVPREFVKRAVMTKVYGVSYHSVARYIRAVYEARRMAGGGGTPFEITKGGGYRAACYLADHVWAALNGRVGAAGKCMDWLQSIAAVAADCGRGLLWTSPSGWPTVQAYREWESHRVRTAIGERVRFSRVREDTDKIHKVKQADGIAPNFVHSMDSALLARAVLLAKDRGVRSLGTVHDCYLVLAADATKVARAVREAAVDTFRSDRLLEFYNEVAAQLPQEGLAKLPGPFELGDFDVEAVLGSQYLLS